jgi:hypothetical protein
VRSTVYHTRGNSRNNEHERVFGKLDDLISGLTVVVVVT